MLLSAFVEFTCSRSQTGTSSDMGIHEGKLPKLLTFPLKQTRHFWISEILPDFRNSSNIQSINKIFQD